MWSIIFGILVVSLTGIYLWLKKCHRYWEIRKVPYLRASSLIFGSSKNLIFGKQSMIELTREYYDKLAPHKFGGVYTFQNPALIIRDPDLVQTVLIKDYQYFFDRMNYLSNEDEPFTQNLFHLNGDEWKTLRQKLSPVFSPTKLKSTQSLVQKCINELITTMDKCKSESNSVDMKDLLARFLIDLVGSCFFGIQSNSLEDPNSEFRRTSLKMIDADWKMIIRQMLFTAAPRITSSLGITLHSNDVKVFFVNLVTETVFQRKKNEIVRNDFLNLLTDLVKNGKSASGIEDSDLTKADIEFMAAQCFLFFLAGYDTSSNASSFALLEIAKHSDIQKRLHEEIDKIWDKYDGDISFDVLHELTYMDQVLAETMRMYPALPILMRTCTKNYVIPNTDVEIEKGTIVQIPIYALHYDELYFSHPENFDPERFSSENKKSIPHCAYLPFGEGPKICLGMRFANMVLKLILFTLLRRYTFSVSPKMELPVKINKRAFIITSDGGIWLEYVKRIADDERNKH